MTLKDEMKTLKKNAQISKSARKIEVGLNVKVLECFKDKFVKMQNSFTNLMLEVQKSYKIKMLMSMDFLGMSLIMRLWQEQK